jgi:uncharacterized protein
MSEENVELVRGAYDDFNSGNPQGVLARLDENVAWTEPGGGNSPSGTFNGPESVGNDVFSKIPENFDEFSAEPEDFKDEGDNVTVTGRFKGKSKSGVELDAPFTHTYEVKDGKVTSLNNEAGDNWTEAWGG